MIYYTSKAKEVVIPEGISGSMPDEGGLKASNIKKGVVILGVTGTLTGGGGDVTVIDSLDSTSTTDALSANQGRVLNEKITAEVTQRKADTEYLTGKDTELTNMITNEANDRIADVTNIELAIGNEEAERKAADASLQDNIDKEAEARSNAVSDEAAERLEQDTQLSTRIDQEVNDRKGACGILQTNIDNEASTRTSEDARLEELIRTISPGTQGLEGPQGAIGTQGVIGTQGHQGNIGQRGTTGLAGVQGDIGTKGPQGSMGTRGPQGVQGTIGTRGTQGVQGVQGIMGVQGPQGVKGAAGLDGLPGAQGTYGTIGTQGYRGEQGDKGTQGDKGVQGDVGPQGPQGASGGGSGTTINVIDSLDSESTTDALSANQGRVIVQDYIHGVRTQIEELSDEISNFDIWEFTTEYGDTYSYLVRCEQL